MNTVIIVIMAAGGAFYAGMHYAQSKTSAAGANFANMTPEERQALRGQFGGGANGGRGGRNGGGGASGEIIAKDDTSMTIKLRDGGSKIVFLSGSTPVMKTASGTPQDLKVGTQVNAMGTANADGSITAQSVQIRPAIPADTERPAAAPTAQ